MNVSIDFETRSRVDLPKLGLDKYSRDPSTEVICMATRSVERSPSSGSRARHPRPLGYLTRQPNFQRGTRRSR
jgi:hypothetical protein